MKKTLIIAAVLILVSSAAAESHFFLAAGASYVRPTDEGYRSIYGNQAIYPELSARVRLIAGFCLMGSTGKFSKSGTTPELGLETHGSQSHLYVGLGYLLRVSPTLCVEAGGGLASLSYREEALGTSVSGKKAGFKAEGGLLLIPEDERIFMGLRLSYMSAQVPGSDLDPVSSQSLKLGGLSFSVCIGIQLFGGD